MKHVFYKEIIRYWNVDEMFFLIIQLYNLILIFFNDNYKIIYHTYH